MTEQEIYDGVVVGGIADFTSIVGTLRRLGMAWCVIDNFAVNAYAESVYTADLDLVVAAIALPVLLENLRADGFKVQVLPNLIRIRRRFVPFVPGTYPLTVSLMMAERYQPFVERTNMRSVLGLQVPVASLNDVVQAKQWHLADPNRRLSAQFKDRFDLLRLAEKRFDEVAPLLPPELRAAAEADLMRRLEIGDNGWGDDDRGKE